MSGTIDSLTRLFNAMNSAARPFLTALIASLFNGICAYAVLTKQMTFNEYVMAIGPTNSMIIGFWFGERAALKNPTKPDA